jgi:gamma-glutamyltranspeptidase/glutathione hydrolase
LIRYEDLADHQTRIEKPLALNWRGYSIYKCGPWTQGPILLQSLRLLESYDLQAMGHNSPDYVHTVVEAMKLALADRDTYYADPLFVDVPIEQLLSDRYTEMRRSLLNPKQASLEQQPGDPRGGKPLLSTSPESYQIPGAKNHDTTTCLVADRWGNVVAATPSGWAGVQAGRTGIVLGSRLISLNTWKGHPNCIAPAKRPRITLTPTLVFKDGKPVIAISVAGGDLQDQTTLQVLLNLTEFKFEPGHAVSADRFSTEHCVGSFSQPAPKLGNLAVNDGIGAAVIEDLEARGHQVKKLAKAIAQPVVICIDPESGSMEAAGDPRAGRHAAAMTEPCANSRPASSGFAQTMLTSSRSTAYVPPRTSRRGVSRTESTEQLKRSAIRSSHASSE